MSLKEKEETKFAKLNTPLQSSLQLLPVQVRHGFLILNSVVILKRLQLCRAKNILRPGKDILRPGARSPFQSLSLRNLSTERRLQRYLQKETNPHPPRNPNLSQSLESHQNRPHLLCLRRPRAQKSLPRPQNHILRREGPVHPVSTVPQIDSAGESTTSTQTIMT